jgi:hypothetical protein
MMSLRFRRTVKLVPGVHLNLGLRGAGLSVGPHGLHIGYNTSRHGYYASAGVPNTGLYVMHHFKGKEHQHGVSIIWILALMVLVTYVCCR